VVAVPVSVEQLLDGHVALQIDCLDRVYLNAYVPNLQVSGQVANFLTKHLDAPIPSPALFTGIGDRFRRNVKRFAGEHDVPLLRFGKPGGQHGERKIDVVRPLMAKAERAQSPGVVAIGVAQEYQNVFTATSRPSQVSAAPQFSFRKEDRRVSCFYFYIWDDDFGPGFVKLCSYFPYPGKVWINGHEWAKRQAAKTQIGFTPLSNGFATCDDATGLQQRCDQLGPEHIQAFADRWLDVIPTPLDDRDKDGGYWWELSMRQVEVSRTLVFDAPRRARAFFEAMVRDNLGIGRPEEVECDLLRPAHTDGPAAHQTGDVQDQDRHPRGAGRSTRSTSTPGSNSI
jgi:hypothetical protein